MRVFLVLLVFSVLVVCASLSVAREEDPELSVCKHQCRQQRQYGSDDKQACERSCERYIREKERRQWEEGGGMWGEEEENERREWELRHRDPQKEYRQCRETCQESEQGRREQLVCESECELRRIEHERERRRWDDEMVEKRGEEEEEEREEFGGKSGWPYVFQDQHFTWLKAGEGRVRVLENFSKRSKLFKRIENYRVMIFESNPQTFIVPNHWDADLIIFVAQGKGTITLVYTDRRESYNIEHGHVMVVPAGVSAYLINRGNTDKLVIVKLINPVSNPGRFEQYYGPGGENPESYFSAFSNDILEAAFKTKGDNLKKLFSQQSGGAIIKASKEQIRALTHEKSGHWPFGGKESKESGPVNLFRQRPKESNDFGSLFGVDLNDCPSLRDLNIAVSFANFTQGSMHTPFYNSRVTNIAVVVNGKGYFEMACPHVSKSGHEQHHHGGKSGRGKESTTPVHYEKINSELRQGSVFVVPPGHPFVTLASEDENLEVVCFEINAENNHKFPLAGQKSIYKNFEKEAKELAFRTSADEVDKVLNNQHEEFFLRGPRQQEHHRFYSII